MTNQLIPYLIPNSQIKLQSEVEFAQYGAQIDGLVRFREQKINIVSLQNNTTLNIPLESHRPFVVEFPVFLSGVINNSFYFKVQLTHEVLNFRLTKNNVSFCNSSLTHEFADATNLLIQIIVLESSWQLLMNNELIFSQNLSTSQNSLNGLQFVLLKDTGDLEVCLDYVSKTYLNANITNFIEEKAARLHSSVDQALKDLNLPAAMTYIKGVKQLQTYVKSNEKLALTKLREFVETKPNASWVAHEFLDLFDSHVKIDFERSLEISLPPPLLEVKKLSINFDKNSHNKFSIKNIFSKPKVEQFTALNQINFKAYPGDIVGVLGANGAGKSTMLKAVAGLLDISGGEIILRGHHILLSPGLGMRNELSGHENIFLACCYMGLSPRETQRIIPEIVEFSELAEKIHEPYKFYSDGMKSRLVFSIATSIAPEILMLDEILGAGDIKFQQKAAQRMDELLNKAKLVILVTHSIQLVEKKCNKALLISRGNQLYFGSPKEAVARYLNELHMPTWNSSPLTADINSSGFLGELLESPGSTPGSH